MENTLYEDEPRYIYWGTTRSMFPTKGQTVTGRTESGTVVTGTVVKHYAFGATAIVDAAGQVHVVEDAEVVR